MPGALSIPLRPEFATWLGWLARPTTRWSSSATTDQDADEIVWQALKIGYEQLVGELDGGHGRLDRRGQSRPASTELVTGRISSVTAARLSSTSGKLSEFTGGHCPAPPTSSSARSPQAAAGLPADEPAVVMCGHGERATGAASLLERAGHHDLAVLDGGPQDWAAATGRHLETGVMSRQRGRTPLRLGLTRQPRPVQAARGGQRPRRRHARPGTDRAAAAGRAAVPPDRATPPL